VEGKGRRPTGDTGRDCSSYLETVVSSPYPRWGEKALSYRNTRCVLIVFLLAMGALTCTPFGSGCTLKDPTAAPQQAAPQPQPPPTGLDGEIAAILTRYSLSTRGDPWAFEVTVPESWEVRPGEIPVGLYWGVANEFAKDAGFDLTEVKGRTLRVRRYILGGESVPGPGGQGTILGVRDLVVLVDGERIAGAWVSFATGGQGQVGMSLSGRFLEELTALEFGPWAEREGLFVASVASAGLDALGPADVVAVFLEAVTAGDKARAYACLSPDSLLRTVASQHFRDASALYQAKLEPFNSVVEGLEAGHLIGWQLLDPESPEKELLGPGELTAIEVQAELELRWRKRQIYEGNPPEPACTERGFRYFTLRRTGLGWRIDLEDPRDLDLRLPSGAGTPAYVTGFLQQHGLPGRGAASSFKWRVPESWEVPLGGYLEGVYWGLANVGSKDIGFDLEPLKGEVVTVWSCPVGVEPRFMQDLDRAILLVREGVVVGAWTVSGSGAVYGSADRRRWEAITGLTLDQWLQGNGYFREAGPNADLAAMDPTEVVKAYFDALTGEDWVRANACLLPAWRLEGFTPRPETCRLYLPDQAPRLPKATWRLKSVRFYDWDDPPITLKDVGDLTKVGIEATIEMESEEAVEVYFNGPWSPQRSTVAFKTHQGWKIAGFGATG